MSALSRLRAAVGAAAGRVSEAVLSAAPVVSGAISAFGGWISEGERLKDGSVWGTGGWHRRTQSGEEVGPERALTVSSYYAALRNISEDVGKLPLITYRRLERGKERAPKHPNYRLLKVRPNRDMSSMTLRETLTHWAIGWGRGIAEIVRDGAGRPRAYWPIHPSRVYPKRLEGELMYVVSTDDLQGPRAEPVLLRAEDVVHIHGLGNGYDGYSLTQLAAETLGLAMAAELQAASFFGNGTQVVGVLKHPGRLSQKAKDGLRASWVEVHAGARNAWQPGVLEEGMEWQPISVPPREAQLIEARQFQVIDVARWLRMQPHKIQELTRSTNNNIEWQGMEYVIDTLLPWLVRWEQELEAKAFAADEEYFAEHVLTMLLRGDHKARSEFYGKMIMHGVFSPDDVRELENYNPIPGGAGAEYYMQSNMAPLRLLAQGEALKPKAAGKTVAAALTAYVDAGRNGTHP